MKSSRITSRQNKIVKDAAALIKDTAKRRDEQRFLCEGARLCRDAALSDIPVKICFYTEQAAEKYAEYLKPILAVAAESYIVEEHVAGLLSSTKSSQGVFCVCAMPKGIRGVIGFNLTGSCLVLENLQDPGNLGTILRTAEALGVNRIFLLGECCDPFSPKVLRASMGAVFRLSLAEVSSIVSLREMLSSHGCLLHASVPSSDALPVTRVDFSSGLHAVFIGNEGNGLTAETIALCDDRITIPMAGRAESLNASAAANILLWEMCRGGGANG